MANLKMVCSYRFYLLDLPVALVNFHMKGCKSCLHNLCQGEYVAMHEINIDETERMICHNCVDELWMGGKPDKLKKSQHSPV